MSKVRVSWSSKMAYSFIWDLSKPSHVASLASHLNLYEDEYEGDDFPAYLIRTLETMEDGYRMDPMVADEFLEMCNDNNWYDSGAEIEITSVSVE